MSQSGSGRIGPGASTILMIVVVLCLTMLGVLALVSARGDAAMSARGAEMAEAYYNAQTEFGLWICQVDMRLKEAREQAEDAEDYQNSVYALLGARPGETVEFETGAGEGRKLVSAIQILPWDASARYRIAQSRLEPIEDAEIEEGAEWTLIS